MAGCSAELPAGRADRCAGPPVRSRPSGVVLSVKSESKAVPVFPLRRDADPDDDCGTNYDRYAPLIWLWHQHMRRNDADHCDDELGGLNYLLEL